MKEIVNKLITQDHAQYVERANCFNAIQLYWGDSLLQNYVEPEVFVKYIGSFFYQLSLDSEPLINDVSIIWSRSSQELPNGQIKINQLLEKQAGYPFGLVIEHAYCLFESGKVFQKPNPNLNGYYEVVDEYEALAPYLKLQGFELTRHRRL